MTAKSRKRPTSEVKESDVKVSTATSEVDKITLDEYLKKVRVNPGLIASFRVEAKADDSLLLPKTIEDWKLALDTQSNKVYK